MNRPSREKIIEIYNEGPDAVILSANGLFDILEEHEVHIKHLEDIIAKNSKNSHKPPSTDKLKKGIKKPINLRVKTGRKPGGQKGHKGYTLKQVEDPDNQVNLHCNGHCACGENLSQLSVSNIVKRQVFDIPEIKIKVTEFCADVVICDCGQKHTASFPEGVNCYAQYGTRIKSFATYFTNYQLIPYERCEELFKDLFKVSISKGTLVTINKRASELLESTNDYIKDKITDSSIVHFDESGFYIDGIRVWIHTATTKDLTYYYWHKGRGFEATNEIDILPKFKGRAIHDFWSTYLKYENCTHGLCNVHHLRELIFVFEQHEQVWAKKMIDLLLEIKDAVSEEVKNGVLSFDKKRLAKYEKKYNCILNSGFKDNPLGTTRTAKRGRIAQTKSRRLLDRFENHRNKVLAYMYDFTVPFGNNLAERDLRMIKVQQKISGCFRSNDCATGFLKIRGYISTVKKQAIDVMEAVSKIFLVNNSNENLLPE